MLCETGNLPGGGGTLPYKPYRYVPPQMVIFLRLFGLKMPIAHFGLQSGIVFEGLLECINVFLISIPNK